jgi:HEAT repeat protein
LKADDSDELRSRLNDLRSSDWRVRQSAAQALGALGEAGVGALDDLREAARRDSDYDVREAALVAVAALEKDPELLLEDLRAGLADTSNNVRRRTADLLAGAGQDEAATTALVERLEVEQDADVVDAIGRALRTLIGDAKLIELTLEFLASEDVMVAWRAIVLLAAASPDPDQRATLFAAIWPTLAKFAAYPPYVDQAFARLLEYAEPATVVDRMLAERNLPGRLALNYGVRDALESRWSTDSWSILGFYGDALRDPEERIRAEAADRLSYLALGMGPEHRTWVINVAREAVERYGSALSLLAALDGPDAAVTFLVAGVRTPTEATARALLLDAPQLLDQEWSERADDLLPFVLAGRESSDWRVRKATADLFTRHAAGIPRMEFDSVETALDALTRDSDADVRQSAEIALIGVRDQKRRTDTRPLVELLSKEEAEGEQAVQDAITKLIELRTPDALRPLVRAWGRWIGLRDRSGLVEFAAEKLRSSPHAVIPLLDQLEQGLPQADELDVRLQRQAVPREVADAVEGAVAGRKLSAAQDEQLREWLAGGGGRTQSAALDGNGFGGSGRPLAKEAKAAALALLEVAREERSVLVRQRVSRQLAEMSDERFFDDRSREMHELICSELRKHAIPILGRRLEHEEDSTIRENIAHVLGNLGGREAVDVLARAIVGEERKTSNRQQLLARYYLEPSRERSDQAATILHGAVAEAKRTLRLLQWLNGAFFVVALGILVTGITLAVVGNSNLVRAIGGAAGLTGFLALLLQLIREPLVRIQNAVTRLVQVETAFASFIWELNLNGTYIQSQYVAEGILSDDEIAATVARIEQAMHLAMDLVARYAEEGHVPAPPRLTTVVPSSGGPGNALSVYGSCLSAVGGNGARKHACRVAINHVPVAAADAVWSDSIVSFTLPQSLPGKVKDGEAVWISLFVNGHETNAVPFRLASP